MSSLEGQAGQVCVLLLFKGQSRDSDCSQAWVRSRFQGSSLQPLVREHTVGMRHCGQEAFYSQSWGTGDTVPAKLPAQMHLAMSLPSQAAHTGFSRVLPKD